jgi:membrane protease YdiL (CAAX protease family)
MNNDPEVEANESAPISPHLPAPTAFTRRGTIAATLVVVILIVGEITSSKPDVAKLDRPAQTAVRVHEQFLTLRDATADTRWLWWRSFVTDLPAHPLDSALSAYDQVLAAETTSKVSADILLPLQVRRAVLLAALGRRDEAAAALAVAAQKDAAGKAVAQVIAYGILGTAPRPSDQDRDLGLAALGLAGLPADDWTSAQVRGALASREGKPDELAAVRGAAEVRGRALLARCRAVELAYALVFALALFLFARAAFTRAPIFQRLAEAPLPARWSPGEAYAVLIRWFIRVSLVAFPLGLAVGLCGFGSGTLAANGVATGVGLVYLDGALLRPRRLGLVQAFGLRPRVSMTLVAASAIALTGIEQTFSLLIQTASTYLGRQSPWTELAKEELLSPSLVQRAIAVVQIVVAAPLFEEIVFRGVLYGGLRRRFSPWPAAVISGAVFALVHGYAPAGTAAIFLGAVAWALVYEQTRSLLPSMFAHSCNNTLCVMADLALR